MHKGSDFRKTFEQVVDIYYRQQFIKQRNALVSLLNSVLNSNQDKTFNLWTTHFCGGSSNSRLGAHAATLPSLYHKIWNFQFIGCWATNEVRFLTEPPQVKNFLKMFGLIFDVGKMQWFRNYSKGLEVSVQMTMIWVHCRILYPRLCGTMVGTDTSKGIGIVYLLVPGKLTILVINFKISDHWVLPQHQSTPHWQ